MTPSEDGSAAFLDRKPVTYVRSSKSTVPLDGLKPLPPEQSARWVLVRWQRWASLLLLGLIPPLVWQTQLTLVSLVAASVAMYAISSLYKLAVTVRAFWASPEVPVSQEEIDALDENALPLYTILLPLYQEENIVAQLVASIEALDYPRDKLDVKILLEPDDIETRQALERLTLPSYFEVLEVAKGDTRGKSWSCNFGLLRARGQLCTIYDAEDQPDPDQLKKAIIAFRKSGYKTACVQAKLNYYNPTQNWLTRCFTVEYSTWFDLVLVGLHAWGAPIPLGGNSNHFRVDVLREVAGWDAFNVTEDADLGIRLYRNGWRTVMIDSVTYEEAASSIFAWLRQRSRWIKGWFHTWLVHMRNPISLFREMGPHGFFSFQVIVFGAIFTYLANPIFWTLMGVWYGTGASSISSLFAPPIFYIGMVGFVAGNLFFIFSHIMGCLRHQHYSLVKYAWLMPIYWILLSVAFWWAIYQLMRKPHHWEKTKHGLHLQRAVAVSEINGRLTRVAR